MATPLDTLLIQQYTQGFQAPTEAQANGNFLARATKDADGNIGIEYVDPGVVGGASAGVKAYGAVGDGVTDDTEALNLAFSTLAAAGSEIYFPPGSYLIQGALVCSAADQAIRFALGAELLIEPNSGTAVFSGARQRIEGLAIRLSPDVETENEFTAANVSGSNTSVCGWTVQVDNDVPNCTLAKITGQGVHVQNFRLTGTGKAFKYGMHVIAAGGGELKYVTVDGFDADVGDDGGNATFGALLYVRGTRTSVKNLRFEGGGRALFPDGVVIVDAHAVTLEDPFIAAPKAQYGIYAADGAEFLYIRGGWIQQQAGDMASVLADSEAIYLGHNCDHFSGKDVTVTGFDYGLGFHGSNNIPNLDGFDTSNNKTAGILVDSKIGGVDWPVSGLTMTGCYAENAAVSSQPIWMWIKSGYVLGGCCIGGGSIGYTTYLIKVETAVAGFTGWKIDGCRIIATDNTGAGILPNVNTDIVFGDANDLERSNTVSSGTYASKVRQTRDPLLNGVTIGSSGTRVARYYSDTYTLNFNANPEVGQIQDVVVSVPGVAAGDMVQVSVPTSHVYSAASQGDVYFCWVSGAGQVTVRRMAGAHFTPGSGSFRISYWQH